MYVTADDGQYTQTQSAGWEAENLVLEQAWNDIEQQLLSEKESVESWSEPYRLLYGTKQNGFAHIGFLCGQMAMASKETFEASRF